jgi:hypothetical protein
VLIPESNYGADGSSSYSLGFSKPVLLGPICGTNGVRVVTGVINYDNVDDDDGGGNSTGTVNAYTNESFAFVVP